MFLKFRKFYRAPVLESLFLLLIKLQAWEQSTEFKDISMEHLSNDQEERKVNGNWENSMIRIFNGGKATAEQMLGLNKPIQESRTVRVTVRNPSRKVNGLIQVVWDRKTIKEFTSVSAWCVSRLTSPSDRR